MQVKVVLGLNVLELPSTTQIWCKESMLGKSEKGDEMKILKKKIYYTKEILRTQISLEL